jgi:hypothetical protein
MSEAEHTPENRPTTPTEKAKRLIKDSTYRIKSMGIHALGTGVFGSIAVNYRFPRI